MLKITRKKGDKIVINGNITITYLGVDTTNSMTTGDAVIGIEAYGMDVVRGEILERQERARRHSRYSRNDEDHD